ncbi:MAG: spore photoproduct lyase [Bacillota bacterium]|nr:spore photoproduct lyase [Bacillota bacterium]
MEQFVPQRVFVQKAALAYEKGERLVRKLSSRGIPTEVYERKVPALRYRSAKDKFLALKRTLVIGVWTQRDFQTCRPSAHYQLPLVSGCPGLCEYCYLSTNLGDRPYVRVYVNTAEILAQAQRYTEARRPEATIFEGSATSDPVAVEGWTGSVAEAIAFFARLESAGFRFVTKFTAVDGLLGLDHRGKTEIRFSINSDYVLSHFEKGVPGLERRMEAARKVARAGYPLGLLIAPILLFPGWKDNYLNLLRTAREYLEAALAGPLTFELITHRFTSRAKSVIRQVYPDTELPLEESERQFKYGQFGYGKFVYPAGTMREVEEWFREQISSTFPQSRILYFV